MAEHEHEREARRSGGLLGKVALAVVSLTLTVALLAVVGEVAVRYREWNRDTVPGTLEQLYYEHRWVGRALVRDTDYYGWFRIDSLGFRGDGFAREKPPGVIRIMAVGGSTTFDSSVSPDSLTWPARLEHHLAELAPGRRIEVVNAGIPGYRVWGNTVRMHHRLHRFDPDVVLLYHAHNDISCALSGYLEWDRVGPRPEQKPAVLPWTRFLRENSLLYNKLVPLLGGLRMEREGEDLRRRRAERGSPDPDDAVCSPRQFERDLRLFEAVTTMTGARTVFIEVVHVSGSGALEEPDPELRARWLAARPFADPDEGLRLYVEYNDIIERVARDTGRPFIETGTWGIGGPGHFSERDPMHFTVAGAERMASRLARALVEAGVLGAADETRPADTGATTEPGDGRPPGSADPG